MQAVRPPNPSANRSTLPSGPPELPIVGQLFRYWLDPIGLMEDAARYGHLVTMSVKPWLVYLINHPDLIREVLVVNHQRIGRWRNVEAMKYLMGDGLVTSDEPLHLSQRRLMQPAFHQQEIKGYAATISDYAVGHTGRWHDGDRVDMAQEMRDLTLNIVARTLFSVDIPEEVKRMGSAFELANKYMSVRFTQYEGMRGLMHRLPLPLTRRFKSQLDYLDRQVFGMIQQRRQAVDERDDLLSHLLRVNDSANNDTSGGFMTDRQVRDEIVTMFAVGHETVTTALTWCCYLLATHPEIQAQFSDELDNVLGDRAPDIADLPNLIFTTQVLCESMRLYPPIWRMGRVVLEPFELAGYQIPTGAMLCLPTLISHRDPRYFSEPMEFQPGRWTPDFREKLHKFAYYPFGGGPRICIGEGFAWMEAKIILATVGQRWRMSHDPRHHVELTPLISLRPKGGMPMVLARRR